MNRALKRSLLALVALALVMGIVYVCARPSAESGMKCIQVEVVHSDGSTVGYSYETTEEYLGALLLDEGVIAGETGTYGLYIVTADGESARYEEDGAYWALYENGDYAQQGIDATPLTDGDGFRLVYTYG